MALHEVSQVPHCQEGEGSRGLLRTGSYACFQGPPLCPHYRRPCQPGHREVTQGSGSHNLDSAPTFSAEAKQGWEFQLCSFYGTPMLNLAGPSAGCSWAHSPPAMCLARPRASPVPLVHPSPQPEPCPGEGSLRGWWAPWPSHSGKFADTKAPQTPPPRGPEPTLPQSTLAQRNHCSCPGSLEPMGRWPVLWPGKN